MQARCLSEHQATSNVWRATALLAHAAGQSWLTHDSGQTTRLSHQSSRLPAGHSCKRSIRSAHSMPHAARKERRGLALGGSSTCSQTSTTGL